MALKYEMLETSGFPYTPSISLIKPCLHYNQPSIRVMDICSAQLVITADNFTLNQFHIALPTHASAEETYQIGRMHRYLLNVNEAPYVKMRLPSAERKEDTLPSAFTNFIKKTPPATLDTLPQDLAHQYAVHFPESMTLRVTQDTRTRFSSFNMTNAPITPWQPIVYKLDNATDMFFHLMAEIAENGQTEAISTTK